MHDNQNQALATSQNQNTTVATINKTTMRVLSASKKSQSKVNENNQNALSKLLDQANPENYQKIMHDVLESYLVSDLYSCDAIWQTNQLLHYAVNC